VVPHPGQWYDARQHIPIIGRIIGNAMNVAALATTIVVFWYRRTCCTPAEQLAAEVRG